MNFSRRQSVVFKQLILVGFFVVAIGRGGFQANSSLIAGLVGGDLTTVHRASQDPDQDAQENPVGSPPTQSPGKPQDEKLVTSDTYDWLVCKPDGALAEFKAPHQPRLNRQTLTPVEGQPPITVRNFLVTFNQDSGLFLFTYHDLFEAPGELAIDEVLRGAMLGSVLNVNGRKLSEQKIRYKTNPGISFEFRFANNEKLYKGVGRIFLVGKRQYQITSIMLEDKFDPEIANAFLNSLRLIEPAPPVTPEGEDKAEPPSKDSKDEPTEPEIKVLD